MYSFVSPFSYIFVVDALGTIDQLLKVNIDQKKMREDAKNMR